MPRNMSFALTTDQIRDRQKDVTRRLGWTFLGPGDRLTAVVKAMGLKKGETPVRLAVLEVVSVRREPLAAIAANPDDCRREGFPDMTPCAFVSMFCSHYGRSVTPDTAVTRIEFRYSGPPPRRCQVADRIQPALPFEAVEADEGN